MQGSLAAAVGTVALGVVAYLYWRRGKVQQLLAAPAEVEADSGTPPCDSKPGADVLLIGDSRIARWLPALQLPAGFRVLNRGRGGETLAALTRRFERDALRCHPRAIVLQSGVNDLVAASFMDADQSAAVVSATVDRIETLARQAAAAGVPMLAMSILPPGRPTLAYRVEGVERLVRSVAEVNAALARVPWPPGVRLLDARELLCGEGGRTVRREFQDDTLHLNDAAYAALNRLLLQALGTTLASEGVSTDMKA